MLVLIAALVRKVRPFVPEVDELVMAAACVALAALGRAAGWWA